MNLSRHFRTLSLLLGALLPIAGSVQSFAFTDQASRQASSATDLNARLHRLHRGINFSQWFAQAGGSGGLNPEHFQNYITEKDVALVKKLGMDHVRFSIDPTPMFNESKPEDISPQYLGYVDHAVQMITGQGLAVLIDIHPPSEFNQRLGKDDRHVRAFASFWRALARHFSDTDPNLVYLEIINEPEVQDGYRWLGIQAKVAAAIREGAPKHTIIATGHMFSSDPQFLFLQPLPDPNVIYNFHFYDPHWFTHQGASWGVDTWTYLREIPYPSTLENIKPKLSQVPNLEQRAELSRYGADQWNAARIDNEMDQVAAWAAQYHASVICDEFGVYRKYSNPEDRARWLHDVRTSLEKHNMGWTMWDYVGGFALVNDDNGVRTPDALTVQALGLNQSR